MHRAEYRTNFCHPWLITTWESEGPGWKIPRSPFIWISFCIYFFIFKAWVSSHLALWSVTPRSMIPVPPTLTPTLILTFCLNCRSDRTEELTGITLKAFLSSVFPQSHVLKPSGSCHSKTFGRVFLQNPMLVQHLSVQQNLDQQLFCFVIRNLVNLDERMQNIS